ncbi:helix-turn-helix domain-containing protein [Listeria sp. PSOL-1]|uniref:helix-turn-helix domain-containing protein n=1 Tax=Listeria sp. PSOL-1 TaxID=1844999 RepID=UPI0013D480AE|nr:helix-turn-helix domain-containing protein [Listeria sp. PSOL-1]
MYKEALLDLSEQENVRLIKILFIAGGYMHREELFRKLGIHNKTLQRRVQSINETFQRLGHPHVIYYDEEKEQYHIQVQKVSLNLNRLTYTYLEESTNFQILDAIWTQSSPTTESLTQQLFISRSEYYRRLHFLNEWLQSFDIKIYKNQFIGEEWQIRFFAYQLYSKIHPQHFLYDRTITESQHQVIEALEDAWQISWNQVQRQRLALWLSLSLQHQGKTSTYEVPASFCQHGKAVNHHLGANFPKNALEKYFEGSNNLDFEQQALICFCTIFPFFPEGHPLPRKILEEVESDHSNLIVKLSHHLLRTFREGANDDMPFLALPDAWYWYTSLGHTLWIKGTIYYFDKETTEFYMEANYRYINVKKIIRETLQQPDFAVTAWPRNQWLLIHKCALFVYKHRDLFNTPLRIGVFLHADTLIVDIYLNHLKYELLKNLYISVEPYQETEDYDLIITNLAFPIQAHTQIYFLTDVGNPQEEQAVHALVQGILVNQRSNG